MADGPRGRPDRGRSPADQGVTLTPAHRAPGRNLPRPPPGTRSVPTSGFRAVTLRTIGICGSWCSARTTRPCTPGSGSSSRGCNARGSTSSCATRRSGRTTRPSRDRRATGRAPGRGPGCGTPRGSANWPSGHGGCPGRTRSCAGTGDGWTSRWPAGCSRTCRCCSTTWRASTTSSTAPGARRARACGSRCGSRRPPSAPRTWCWSTPRSTAACWPRRTGSGRSWCRSAPHRSGSTRGGT